MEDNDIRRLRNVLKYTGRDDLADLLQYSVSILEESSTFGSHWYSRLSTFHIKSHPSIQAKIDILSESDKDEIFRALQKVYPLRDSEPEITAIIYYPDFEINVSDLVETKGLERVSFEYIRDQIKKCHNKIADNDFDGSVTNARNLIESICLFILESKTKVQHDYDGNLSKLYKTVSSILKMSPGDYEEENLKQILSGVFSIINGVSSLRNRYGDSHGTSPSKTNYKIDERHAILAVNLSKTISEYLFLSYEKSI